MVEQRIKLKVGGVQMAQMSVEIERCDDGWTLGCEDGCDYGCKDD